LYYTSADCASPPWVIGSQFTTQVEESTAVVLTPSGGVQQIYVPSGAGSPLAVVAYRQAGGTPMCLPGDAGGSNAAPAVGPITFVPPYELDLTP
jgi:hypothetical protein